MNKFTRKDEFLKKRATSLHKSGYNPSEVARMLQISKYTAYSWLTHWTDNRPAITKALKQTQIAAASRWSGDELPTLAFVPQIKLTANSKYRMAQHG